MRGHSKNRGLLPLSLLLAGLLLVPARGAAEESTSRLWQVPAWNDSASGGGPWDELSEPREGMTPKERQEIARELGIRGRRALEDQDFEAAVRQLEASYRLSGDPELLRPLASALAALQRFAAAAERLRRYLDLWASQIDEATRIQLEREHQELCQKFSRVNIRSEPGGASVLLGERLLGTTPFREPFFLNRGRYRFDVHLEGYRDALRDVFVAGGGSLDLLFRLESLPGQGSVSVRRGPRWWHLGWEIALWASIGLTVAAAATLGVAVGLYERISVSYGKGFDRGSQSRADALDWRETAYGLAAATGVFGALSITLASLRLAGLTGAMADGD